jgi:hypothetical protein
VGRVILILLALLTVAVLLQQLSLRGGNDAGALAWVWDIRWASAGDDRECT